MSSLARKPETLMVTASPRSTVAGVSRNRGVMVKPLRETMLPATTKRTSLAPPTMVGHHEGAAADAGGVGVDLGGLDGSPTADEEDVDLGVGREADERVVEDGADRSLAGADR